MSNLIEVQSVNKTYKRGEETLVVLDDLSLEVEVAEETSNYARIISGLSSGLKVVARFDYELEDNQKVTIN